MKYFTVEIAGKAVAAFRTVDREDAEQILEAAYFREDLTVLSDPDGQPLWDGQQELCLRKASKAEVTRVDKVWEDDEDTMKREEDEYIAFLVPVNDPTNLELEGA